MVVMLGMDMEDARPLQVKLVRRGERIRYKNFHLMVVHPPFCVTVILFLLPPFFPSIDGTISLLLTIVNIVVYLNISLRRYVWMVLKKN